ncbi:hypothetical protein [Micromonospora sp. WMMD1082]|uniref:hypothetical protein n=1 Tax=Micromonospora sp. WMMD1082 TaxID=3016104 RepID=UPI002415BAEA|nr:hypothetical protein [Micromonospora sp. WMMD1082]MDG4792702.1 hypothetical protein [Micromonospora sp. WMMD1082]
MTYGADPTVALLADIYGALTGEPHPMRPAPVAKPAANKPSVIDRLKAQRERIARQRGEIP